MGEINRYVIGETVIPGDVDVKAHPRCGDDDRRAAEDRIQSALAEGHLKAEQAGARLEAIAASETVSQLRTLVSDLPQPPEPVRTWKDAFQEHQPLSGVGLVITSAGVAVIPLGVLLALNVATVWVVMGAGVTIPAGIAGLIAALCSVLAHYGQKDDSRHAPY